MKGKNTLELFNIAVEFSRREDGGLRASCDAVPGFCISHSDPELVVKEVPPVLEVILSAMIGGRVSVAPLQDVAQVLGIDSEPELPAFLCQKNYVGQRAAA